MKKLLFLIIPLFCTPFFGCADNVRNMSRFFYSMNTEAILGISDKSTSANQKKFESLCNDIENELSVIENSLSSNIETSSIFSFNLAPAGSEVEITKTAYEVLEIAKNMHSFTNGYYNPAVYYSVQAYAFNGLSNKELELKDRIPKDEDEIRAYTALASHFGETRLYEKDNKYYVKKSEQTVTYNNVTYSMKIDLGGIGKGYAVDRVNALIDKYNFKNGFFNFGSSSIACKKYYKSGDYTLSLINPRNRNDNYAQFKVRDTVLSTSGDYENFFESDGIRYCHVFNPFTGKPIETGIMSATLVGGSAAEGDTLTTALMAMGKEKAVAFINEKLTDYKIVFTYESAGGYEVITNIQNDEILILSEEYFIVSTAENGKIVLNG